MGGVDKGALLLGEGRLVDHVLRRLRPQADELVIAGPHDYGLGCKCFPDRESGPAGPAAGLYATSLGIMTHFPGAGAFFTVPVDGPFTPVDLVQRLLQGPGSAIAATRSGRHPTFAFWELAALAPALERPNTPSLREIASLADARQVHFEDEQAFMNINTPDDLETARRLSSGC